MKEATGDMTMTIVVIVSVIFILGIAPTIWNAIKDTIIEKTEEIDTPYIVPFDYNI